MNDSMLVENGFVSELKFRKNVCLLFFTIQIQIPAENCSNFGHAQAHKPF